jgi:hypothetical protein
MRQDHVKSRPIRNLTRPAKSDSTESLTSTAIQHPKNRPIGGSAGENDLYASGSSALVGESGGLDTVVFAGRPRR